MVENYVVLSLETHLFFARIMKEHAFFLEAGFPCKDQPWIQKADTLRQQFEELLWDAVKISSGRINECVLTSGELVTEFTIAAEKRTQKLSGVVFDTDITMAEKNLRAANGCPESRATMQAVHRLNARAIRLLNELICFKENILREVSEGRLFNANYPLLIEHILREAKLYRATVEELMRNRRISYQYLCETEVFWNQIMMEHALFIRGLLDPSEEELIDTADQFAAEYKELLEMAKSQDCKAMGVSEKSLAETLRYREFKEAGTKGILNCEIASIILPLLADHVLREANHYIRILECGKC